MRCKVHGGQSFQKISQNAFQVAVERGSVGHASSTNEVKNPSSEREDSQDEEEEKTEALVGRGKTNRELRQILCDAKNFIREPRYSKRNENSQTDWAGSSVDRKSTSGYCFNIGSGITSWCNRKQNSMALSSSEAKYMVASTTLCEAIWLRKLLVNLFKRNMEATRIICDNQSCIKLSENLVFHDRSKHIDISCHFVRDCVQCGAVQLSYTLTGEKVADILTKALGKSNFD
eukprot:PITA_30424